MVDLRKVFWAPEGVLKRRSYVSIGFTYKRYRVLHKILPQTKFYKMGLVELRILKKKCSLCEMAIIAVAC